MSQLQEMAAEDSSASGTGKCKTRHKQLLLSSAFSQTPLALPFSSPQIPGLVSPLPRNIIHQLQDSFVSAVDGWFNFVKAVASRNPVLKNVLSVSSGFQNLCREVVDCRTVNVKLSNYGFAAVLPGDSVAGMVVANGILNFLSIYNTLLVVRLVLTWFPNTPPAIVSPLSTICDPYLNIFRGLIPPLGGTLDLSPILAFLVLNAFTSTASALPAELPVDGQPPVRSQDKWFTRLNNSRSNTSIRRHQ